METSISQAKPDRCVSLISPFYNNCLSAGEQETGDLSGSDDDAAGIVLHTQENEDNNGGLPADPFNNGSFISVLPGIELAGDSHPGLMSVEGTAIEISMNSLVENNLTEETYSGSPSEENLPELASEPHES